MDKVTIVILAAGLGTRMKSGKAKVLHQAGGRSLIEHVVASALEIALPERVFVVVGRQAEAVEAAVAAYGLKFVRQDQQLGTGDALRVCREHAAKLDGDLVVLYGDCPLLTAATIRRLVETQRSGESAATVITTVLEDPFGYGRVIRGGDGSVCAIVEQRSATPEQLSIREINSGIYCFQAGLLWRYLCEITPDNAAGEYYLTDIVEIFRRAGRRVSPLLIEDSSELLGINTRIDLAQVDALFRMRKARELMLEGVTIEKPETVVIDAAVSAGRDTIIEAFARLLGNTRIGANCRIGAFSLLRDATIADGVEIKPHSIVESRSA